MHPPAPGFRTQHDAAHTFQDLMAEQLRHAPWLLFSALLHATALLLLWALMPTTAPTRAVEAAQIVFADQPEPATPPPPPEIPTTHEVVDATPTLVDVDQPLREAPSENDQPAIDAFDSPAELASATVGIGAGPRFGPTGRGKRGGRDSGTPAPTAAAITAALDWLQRHQDEDGRFDADQFMKHDTDGVPCDGPGNAVHDIGVTGLALLAFLGDGSTMRSGPYKDNVRRAVRWLRDQQEENGRFGSASSHDFLYDHAIATYAMCEACGLSDSPTIRPNAQAGLDYLESHRNPYSVWRYQPRDGDNDSSVTGWCVMAYESGRDFGLDVNPAALKLAAHWFDQVTDATGRCGYTRAGEPSSRHPGDHGTRYPVDKTDAMTAVGLFCRYFLGQSPKEHPIMDAAADRLLERPPVWDAKAGTIDEYYWYYGTYALFQRGGRHWAEWSRRLSSAVVRSQRADGNARGSWDPIGAWGEDGGRVYSTAILALTLEAHYRYTRLVR